MESYLQTLGIALAAATHSLFQWAFQAYLAPLFPPALPLSLVDTSRGLMSAALSDVSTPIAIEAAVLTVIGIIMLLATRLKKPIPKGN